MVSEWGGGERCYFVNKVRVMVLMEDRWDYIGGKN